MLRASITLAVTSLLLVGCSTPGDDILARSTSTPTPEASATASATPTPTPQASSSPEVSPSPGDEDPVRLARTVIKTKQGQRWELEADEVDWMNNNQQAKAQDVTWFLLGPKGERTVKVESPGAEVDMQAEVVTFTGQVTAQRTDSEESLIVKHLVYKGKEKLFYGSEGVLWKRKGFELAGQTLTATADLDKVQLKGRVKGKSEGSLPGAEDGAAADQRSR